MQWGIPAGAPLYPVARMFLSRTITAPTFARVHVERSATSRVMVRKYWCQLGRSLISTSYAGSRQHAQWFGDERQDEDDERRDGQEPPPGVQGLRVVVGRGMASQPHEHGGDDRPDDPARPPGPTEPHQERDHRRRNHDRVATEGRVEDVPAVELS